MVQKHLGADSLAALARRQGWPPERLGVAGRLPAARRRRPPTDDRPEPSVKQLGSTDLKRLHREWRRRTPGRLGLRARRGAEPFNVGADPAHARRRCGSTTCGWSADTPGPEHAKVGKTALGAERYLTSTVVEGGGAAAVGRARPPATGSSASSWPTAPRRCTSCDLGRDVCLVVGHEDRGLTPATLDACDDVGFASRSSAKIGSLNVATAAAIALYEVRRREWTDGPIDPG